jgi:lipid-A-disaccharide synthase-like uncharacterized protein
MASLHQMFWFHDHFLGVEWGWWKAIGWLGNAIFFSRFFVQWYATEKRRQVVVPLAFWWLSLTGSLVLLAYGLFWLHDSVVIFAYAFTWIPYIRNLIIHKRHADAHLRCPECEIKCPPKSNYCMACGTPLVPTLEPVAAGGNRPRS